MNRFLFRRLVGLRELPKCRNLSLFVANAAAPRLSKVPTGLDSLIGGKISGEDEYIASSVAAPTENAVLVAGESANEEVKHSLIIDVDRRVEGFLQSWPGHYRIAINSLVRDISNNMKYAINAKAMYIDSTNWENYQNVFRREFMKNPIKIFDNNNSAFLEFCDNIDLIFQQQDAVIVLNSPPPSLASPSPSQVPEKKEGVLQRKNKGSSDSSSKFGISSDKMDEIRDKIYSSMLAHAQRDLLPQISAYRTLCNTSDLRIPHEWYPAARIMKRKIVYHGGPTNSGKVKIIINIFICLN